MSEWLPLGHVSGALLLQQYQFASAKGPDLAAGIVSKAKTPERGIGLRAREGIVRGQFAEAAGVFIQLVQPREIVRAEKQFAADLENVDAPIVRRNEVS